MIVIMNSSWVFPFVLFLAHDSLFFTISEDFSITLSQDIIKCHLIINQTAREFFFFFFSHFYGTMKQQKAAEASKLNWQKVLYAMKNALQSQRFVSLSLSLLFLFFLTNSTPRRNTKETVQSPHWHFNGIFNNPTQLSILFRSAKHVQFSDSNDCWQFSNSSFLLSLF